MPQRSTSSTLKGCRDYKTRLSFGGSLLKGRRKTARPFCSRQALHVVLRSEQARGKHSLLNHARTVEGILKRQAQLKGLDLLDRANVGNHLHLIVRAPTREALGAYLRAVAGLVVRRVTGRERGRGRNCGATLEVRSSSFWDARPFSRVVPLRGQSIAVLKRYLQLNRMEALGYSKAAARDILQFCRETGFDPPTA